MGKYNLMGIVLENRSEFAPDVQKILTRFGCIIKMRIGLHEKDEESCSNEGFIILQLDDDKEKIEELINELNKVNKVRAKNIEV